jgi:hypothetical protein
VHWLTAFALTIVGGVALIGNRIHAAGNDAVFTQSLVNRAARFGGTYYQNGISPKGPFEDVAHDIALRVGGYDGHWYVISIMIAISAVVLGAAAAKTAMTTGGNRHVGLAVAVIVFIHFTLSDAPYAGLLYSRNILETLLAAAWFLTLEDAAWTARPRVQLSAAIAAGALLGFGVQTILPSLFDAMAIGLAALLLIGPRVDDEARRGVLRRAAGFAAIGAFLSAPVWYLLRGSFAEFWASWWTYARDQNVGIGLSLGQQISRGWHNAYTYYQHRPLVFLMLFAFAVLTFVTWPKLDRKLRIVHLALLGWFAGGWFQLVTGERYSTHYFSVIAVPTAMIGAALAGHAFRAVSEWPRLTRTTVAWPLVAILLSVYMSSGTAARFIDAASITSGFTSAHRGAELALENQSPTNRSIQAVLDLVSAARDPLLAYSDNQFIYPDYRRIPATRFQQRYFLIGSIYLGRTSPKYILHNTWNWFRDDLKQANPAAFLQTDPVDSKPFADYVTRHFEKAFTGAAGSVELRDDVAQSVLNGAATQAWSVPTDPAFGPGWKVAGNRVRYERNGPAATTDRLVLAARGCQRIDGTLSNSLGTSPAVVFHVEDASGHKPETRIAFDGSSASTEDSGGAVLEQISTGSAGTGPVNFSLVIGRRAVALVIGDRIVGAVAAPANASISVESTQSQLDIRNLRVGAPPIGSGC